jgi:hypothetical protein
MELAKTAFVLLSLFGAGVAGAQIDSVPTAPPQAAAAADDARSDAVCTPAQMRVHPRHEGAPMRLNDWLLLNVGGACRTALENAVAATNRAPGGASQQSGVTLLLNGVAMQNLPMLVERGSDASALQLGFRLQRDSNDDANRDSWNDFLRNGESCCAAALERGEMEVALAIAIGNAPAAMLDAAQNIRFRAENRGIVAGTFWVLLILFVAGYALAIRSPSLLRDVPEGSFSLAKSQMAFWGLIVALSFAGIWFVIGTMEQIPNDVLILLGISVATGWLSPFAGESSEIAARARLNTEQAQAVVDVQAATVTATDTEAPVARLNAVNAAIRRIETRAHLKELQGFLRDICSDGSGISVHRVQAVAWTLMLGVVFVCEVTMVISMPVFADNLLLLLGISNGAYLTLKTREQP